LLNLTIANDAIDGRNDHRMPLILLRKIERSAGTLRGRFGFL
jgi:hypothetical protein